MRKKLSMNAICYLLAGIIAVGVPCYSVIASNVSTTKRSGSGIKSSGNIEYKDKTTGETTTLFAVSDLYYLENRIEDELTVICK